MAKPFIPALALLFLVVSVTATLAQQEFEKKIAGKWRGDPAKTRAYLKLPNLSNDADENYLKEIARIRVEFGSDHSIVVREGDSDQMVGEWTLIKDEDGQIEIDLIRDEQATRASFEFLDENAVAVSLRNERPLVFTREGTGKAEGIAAQLVGTWEFDQDATQQLDSNKAFDQAELDDMLQEAARMTVSFSKDGSFTLSKAGAEEDGMQGTWASSNLNESKKSLTLSLDAERGPKILDVEFRDDGRVRISPPNEPSAVFVRQSKKSEK